MLITIDLDLDATGNRARFRGKTQLENVIISLAFRLHVGNEGQHLAHMVEDRPHRLGTDQHEIDVFAVTRLRLEIQLVERSSTTPGKTLGKKWIGIDRHHRARNQQILLDLLASAPGKLFSPFKNKPILNH